MSAHALPFALGVIPSEVADSLAAALPVMADLGLAEVELSEVDGQPLPALTPGQAAATADRLARAGVRVRVGGTQLFKLVTLGDLAGPVLDHPPVRADLLLLAHALRLTRTLGGAVVRLYAFRREGMVGLGNPSPILPDGGPIPDPIVARAAAALRAAGDLAGELGMTLAVENVRSCWANTGVNLARLVAAADHPAVRVCWDPANDLIAGGDPAGSGHAAVRARVVAAHLKDARVVDRAAGLTAWAAIGDGEVDVADQLRRLAADGFAGLASLETHWAPPGGTRADGTRRSFAGLLAAARRATPEGVRP
jgi:L-ribulose-5-phosphate 3-epimerase